jgi:hypothetical protein
VLLNHKTKSVGKYQNHSILKSFRVIYIYLCFCTDQNVVHQQKQTWEELRQLKHVSSEWSQDREWQCADARKILDKNNRYDHSNKSYWTKWKKHLETCLITGSRRCIINTNRKHRTLLLIVPQQAGSLIRDGDDDDVMINGFFLDDFSQSLYTNPRTVPKNWPWT